MTWAESFLVDTVKSVYGYFQEPENKPKPSKDAVYDKIVKDLFAFCEKERVENKKIELPPPSPVYIVVLRQTRSWKVVDQMLDTVKTNFDNQPWKNKVVQNMTRIMMNGQKINEHRGNSAQIIGETLSLSNELKDLCAANIPADCKDVALYIKIHLQSLILFTHSSEISPSEEGLFVEVLKNTDIHSKLNLMESVRGTFEIKETNQYLDSAKAPRVER